MKTKSLVLKYLYETASNKDIKHKSICLENESFEEFNKTSSTLTIGCSF